MCKSITKLDRKVRFTFIAIQFFFVTNCFAASYIFDDGICFTGCENLGLSVGSEIFAAMDIRNEAVIDGAALDVDDSLGISALFGDFSMNNDTGVASNVSRVIYDGIFFSPAGPTPRGILVFQGVDWVLAFPIEDLPGAADPKWIATITNPGGALQATGGGVWRRVPEPTTLALLSLGIIGITYLRRKNS